MDQTSRRFSVEAIVASRENPGRSRCILRTTPLAVHIGIAQDEGDKHLWEESLKCQ